MRVLDAEGREVYSEVQGYASGARGLPKMAAPFVFDYLAHLIIAPQPERANPAPRSVPLGAGILCVAIRRPLRVGRGRRVSSFRWLPQNVAAPIPNCLDFGWPCRTLKKAVRWRGLAVTGVDCTPRVRHV